MQNISGKKLHFPEHMQAFFLVIINKYQLIIIEL